VGPVRITVVQAVVTNVTFIPTGESMPPGSWYTIEQLYELIPSFARQEGVADVSVTYDPALGYPSSVAVRYEEGILDAGSRYSVSAVGPVQ
jgi:hypothetical protein